MCSKPIFCSKIALKGKTCSRLLKPQKVAPNAKSCSKVAEHNRDRPTDEGQTIETSPFESPALRWPIHVINPVDTAKLSRALTVAPGCHPTAHALGGSQLILLHPSRPRRPRSFWSAPRITTSSPTPEVRDSRTSRYPAHAQNQV